MCKNALRALEQTQLRTRFALLALFAARLGHRPLPVPAPLDRSQRCANDRRRQRGQHEQQLVAVVARPPGRRAQPAPARRSPAPPARPCPPACAQPARRSPAARRQRQHDRNQSLGRRQCHQALVREHGLADPHARGSTSSSASASAGPNARCDREPISWTDSERWTTNDEIDAYFVVRRSSFVVLSGHDNARASAAGSGAQSG